MNTRAQKTENRGKSDSAWRKWLFAGIGTAAMTLAPVRIVAQEAPLIRLAFDDECASSGSTGLGDALLARMPDARFGNGEGSWTLQWAPAGGGSCELILTRGEVEQRMTLAANAGEDELEQAASRIAWWLASEAPASEVRASEGSGEGPIEEPPVIEEPPRPVLPVVPVVVSLWPSISAPVRDEPFRSNFGFHVIGSAEEELDGFEMALGWNHLRGWGRGLQLGTFANVTDDEFNGAQITGGLNLSRGVFNGAQFGAVNVAQDELRGAQFGQINIARDVRGAQFAQINVARGDVNAQFGSINVADTANLQLGFVNVANSADASIGFISVVRDQPLYFNVGGNATSMVTFGLRHGSRSIQNIIELEVDAELPEVMTLGYGIGGHFGRGNVFGEVDVIARAVLNTARTGDLVYRGTQGQLRATIGYRIARRLAIVGGPTYTVFAARKGRVDRAPNWASVLYDSSTDADVVLGWVGAYVGLRF